MPIFKARIKVMYYVDIPVAAESAQAAMVYLRASDDWHEAGGLEGVKIGSVVAAPESVELVKAPIECKKLWSMSGADLCWGAGDDEDVLACGVAFYADRFNRPYPADNDYEDEESLADAWFDWFRTEKERAIAEFDRLIAAGIAQT